MTPDLTSQFLFEPKKEYKIKYLSPRTDIGFKKLFGNPHHKNLTISFLNSILDRKEPNLITEVTFTETEQLPETEGGKKSFFDVYCTDRQGNKFIIEIQIGAKRQDEMQSKYQAHFMFRAQYYTGLALYRQVHAPFKYEKLVPIIFIGVLDHILFDKINDVITRHTLMDMKNHTTSSSIKCFISLNLKNSKRLSIN